VRTSRHPISFSRRSSCRQFHDGYLPTIRRLRQIYRGTREESDGQSQAVLPSGLWQLPETGEPLHRDLCHVRGSRAVTWISQSRRRLHLGALESSIVEPASRSTIECSFRPINFQKDCFGAPPLRLCSRQAPPVRETRALPALRACLLATVHPWQPNWRAVWNDVPPAGVEAPEAGGTR